MLPLILAGVALPALAWFFGGDFIKKNLKGKKIVIVGPRGAGKSTLYHFLQHGKISDVKMNPTQKDKICQPKAVKIGDVEIVMKDCYDTGGSLHYKDEWVRQIKGSDYVFFLFRLSDAFDASQAESSKNFNLELNRVVDALSEKESPLSSAKKIRLFIVGTHLDLLPSYLRDREKDLIEHPRFQDIIYKFGGLDHSVRTCHVVSLNSQKSVEHLLKDCFHNLGK